MAKHLYITNKEGGYFYRIYPKIKKIVSGKTEHPLLFDAPPEDESRSNLTNLIYGRFIDKYHDGGKYIIEIFTQAEILITCTLTGKQEQRMLTSHITIEVPANIYNYPFVKNDIYAIKTDSIQQL